MNYKRAVVRVTEVMKDLPTRAEIYIAIAVISLAMSIVVMNMQIQPQIQKAMSPMLDRLERSIEKINGSGVVENHQSINLGPNEAELHHDRVMKVLAKQGYLGENP